jgi:hypothetical protein
VRALKPATDGGERQALTEARCQLIKLVCPLGRAWRRLVDPPHTGLIEEIDIPRAACRVVRPQAQKWSKGRRDRPAVFLPEVGEAQFGAKGRTDPRGGRLAVARSHSCPEREDRNGPHSYVTRRRRHDSHAGKTIGARGRDDKQDASRVHAQIVEANLQVKRTATECHQGHRRAERTGGEPSTSTAARARSASPPHLRPVRTQLDDLWHATAQPRPQGLGHFTHIGASFSTAEQLTALHEITGKGRDRRQRLVPPRDHDLP